MTQPINSQLETVDALVEKENEMVLSQEKLAQQMEDIRAKFDTEGSDHIALDKEFKALMRQHSTGEKNFKNTQARRKLLEEKIARDAIRSDAAGNDVPLMKVSEAVAKSLDAWRRGEDPADRVSLSLNQRGYEAAIAPTGVQIKMTSNPAVTRSGISNTQDFGTNAGAVRTADFYGERRKAFGGAEKMISIITTEDGIAEKYPNIDFVDGTNAIGVTTRTEASAGAGDSLPVPNEVTLKPYSMSSGSVELSLESNRDIPAGTLALANRAVSRALKNHWNNELTNGAGDGNEDTQGLITGAGASTATGNSTNPERLTTATITWQVLLKLIENIDAAYRDDDHDADLMLGDGFTPGRIGFMFHQTAETAIKLMTDSEGRPIWAPDIRGGMDHKLFGYDYVLNQSMPTFAQQAGTLKRGVFLAGNFSTYTARIVPSGSYLDFYSQDRDLREKRKMAVNGFMEGCGAYLSGFSSGTTSEAVQRLDLAGS